MTGHLVLLSSLSLFFSLVLPVAAHGPWMAAVVIRYIVMTFFVYSTWHYLLYERFISTAKIQVDVLNKELGDFDSIVFVLLLANCFVSLLLCVDFSLAALVSCTCRRPGPQTRSMSVIGA